MNSNWSRGKQHAAETAAFLAILLSLGGVAFGMLPALDAGAGQALGVAATTHESWAALKERKLSDFASLAKSANTDEERRWVREAEAAFSDLAAMQEQRFAVQPGNAIVLTPEALSLDDTQLQAYMSSIQPAGAERDATYLRPVHRHRAPHRDWS